MTVNGVAPTAVGSAGAWYHGVVAPKPFKITARPRPLTTNEIVEKYRLPRTTVRDIADFIVGVKSSSKAQIRDKVRVRDKAKSTAERRGNSKARRRRAGK